jgi:hypothetical protein
LVPTPDDDVDRWPDPDEVARWRRALTAIAERERRERAVIEPAGIRVDHGDLVADYGPVKFLVASTRSIAGGLPDEEELFESIDAWVAFDRPAGPGVLLPRDQAAIDAWELDLAAAEAAWPALIERVVHDVEATTDLHVTWQLEREDEQVVIPPHEGATFARFGGPPLAKRTFLLPELWVRTDGLGTYRLGPLDNGDPDAVAFSLASFAERVQDDVIDEVWGAWPPCPRHGHPLQVTSEGHRAAWVCPAGGDRGVDVGALAQS